MTEEPKDRLRRARLAAKLTIEELAELVGRAVTTVRAHENGQNGIKAAAASMYAEQLNVDPSWILFGTGVGPKSGAELEQILTQASYLGDIRRGTWVQALDPSLRGFIPVYAPQYSHVELNCYQNLEPGIRHRVGTYLFAVDPEGVTITTGDELIIVRTRDENLTELSLWDVVNSGGSQRLVCQSKDHPADISWDELEYPLEGIVYGVVVGGLWVRETRAFKPLIF